MTSYPVIDAELSETQQEFIDWIETDEDISMHRHTVEFLGAGQSGGATAVAYIRHTMKRIESGQGRDALIESRFELAGQDVPHVRARYDAVERAVQVWFRSAPVCSQ